MTQSQIRSKKGGVAVVNPIKRVVSLLQICQKNDPIAKLYEKIHPDNFSFSPKDVPSFRWMVVSYDILDIHLFYC